MVIGLLGGVASGKSTIAAELERRGGVIIDADKVGHEVLESPEIQAAFVARWGSEVIRSDGKADRSQIAKRVFAPPPAGPAELDFLEKLTHPAIGTKIRSRLAELQGREDAKFVILDAALLLKAGWNSVCDKIIFVETSLAERQRRAATRGWSADDLAAREARQEPLDKKRAAADFIVRNDGPPEEARQQVESFLQSIDSLSPISPINPPSSPVE